MGDPFAAPLLGSVLDARKTLDAAQAQMVDARRRLWKAAKDAGLGVIAQRFADRSTPPESLVAGVEGRQDPPAVRVREACDELYASERAASSANDSLVAALGRLREALPPDERGVELVERLMGRPGRQYHRVFTLEGPRARTRVAARAVCGRKRTLFWRPAARRPVSTELCEACQGSRLALADETDEVRTAVRSSSGVRRAVRAVEALVSRVAGHALPVTILVVGGIVAGVLLDLGPVVDNPLGRFVATHVNAVIGR